MLSPTTTVRAQLCTGSLGDPVVNITFGTTVQALSSRQTSYSFASCPEDGEYTIATSVPPCHANDNSWHPLTQDHTPGDNNGVMMIVNASYAPGDFYVDTVRGLCSNTTYEFAAWVMNILAPGSFCFASGTVPNISFSIERPDGTIIQQYTTGNIAATTFANWKQYGFFFDNSNTSEVVLRLTNNGPGGCGNDLALDDITFRPCGPEVQAIIQNRSSDTFAVCQGSTASLVLQGSVQQDFTNPAFQWQRSLDKGTSWQDIPGATNTTYPVSIAQQDAAGSNWYRIAVARQNSIGTAQCRVASNTMVIDINSNPTVDLPPVIAGCQGKALQLQVSGGYLYNWTGPGGFVSKDSTIIIDSADATNAGTYTVEAITAAGCRDVATTNVLVNANPVANAGITKGTCEGQAVQLNGRGGNTYTWSPASGLSDVNSSSPWASPQDTTTYLLTVTNTAGCSDTASVTVLVWKKPSASAGPDKQLMAGDTTVLEGSIAGSQLAYSWSPATWLNNSQALQPIAAPVQNTTYTLQVTSLLGCGTATDEVFIRVFKKIDIPNAFSPNADGQHDVWLLKDIDSYPEADISVFNRYGVPVYKGKGTARPWDGTHNGKPLPVATYYYIIDLKNNFPKKSGWVMLLR